MHMLSTHPTFLELVHVQLTAVLMEPSQTVHKRISIGIHWGDRVAVSRV